MSGEVVATSPGRKSKEIENVKKIKNATLANPFNGSIIDVVYDFRRDANGQVIRDEKTGEGLYPITTPQTTALVIRTFISNYNPKEVTMDDSHKALRILDVLRPFKLLEKIDSDHVTPATINLEDAEYDWLVAKYKERGTQSHGVFAALYMKAIEDYMKEEERATPAKSAKVLSAGKV